MIPFTEPIELIKAGELDIWGNPSLGETIELRANLRSETKVVKDGNGNEQVSAFTLLFVGVVDIRNEDTIRFTEANGEIIEMNPISVKFMRGLDGQPKYTKVVL